MASLSDLLGKTVKAILVTTAVVVVAVVSLLPFVLRWQMVGWLEQQGLEAEIGYINIRPVLGSIQINDVRIAANETEQLILKEVQLNIDWTPLLSQWLKIEHVLIDGLAVDLVVTEEGLRVGGIPVPESDPEGAAPSQAEPDSGAAITRMLLERLEMANSQLCYARLAGNNDLAMRQCVAFKQLALTGSLDLKLGDAPSAAIPGVFLQDVRWADKKESVELAGVAQISAEAITSEDMVSWHVADVSVESLGVLPVREEAEIVSGDLYLSRLSLSGLDVGADSRVGRVSLSGLQVDLNLGGNGEALFSPRLMASLEPLLPETPEVKDVDQNDNPSTFSVGQLIIDSVSVSEGRHSQKLLSFNDFDLQQLSILGSDVVLKNLQVSDFVLLPVMSEQGQTTGDLELRRLSLADASFGEAIHIGELDLSSMNVGLDATTTGQLAFAPELIKKIIPETPVQEPQDLAVQNNSQQTAFAMDRLVVAGISVRDKVNQRDLLLIHDTQLSGLTAEGDALTLAHLQLSDLKLLERNVEGQSQARFNFSTPKIELTGIDKAASRFALKELTVVDPVAVIHRNASGGLQLVADVARMTTAESGADPSSSELSEPPVVVEYSVGQVRIGSKGRLLVLDESVSPVFQKTFNDLNIMVDNIESSSPEASSLLAFNLAINKFGHIKFNGNLSPFGDKLNTAIEGELRGLDARELSSYASQYIGYSLDQGVAEADIKFAVRDDDIDASVITRFHKLEVSPLSENEMPEGAESLGVPLDFALGLLRDKNGMIELNLPITGDIHSPDFSLRHIIGKVMFKVISETIVNYYLPFGLIVKATLQDTLSNLTFEPILFVPGDTALTVDAVANLDKLSELLGSREQLSLSFCAPSTWQDWSVKFAPVEPEGGGKVDDKSTSQEAHSKTPVEVVTPEQVAALKQMSNQRSDVVKEYLVNKGVQSGQVILCEGDFTQENKGLPQMDIAI